MIVTVKIEPWGLAKRLHYVARDGNGDWHTYGLVERKQPTMSVAKYLYHSDEVESVVAEGGVTTIKLRYG